MKRSITANNNVKRVRTEPRWTRDQWLDKFDASYEMPERQCYVNVRSFIDNCLFEADCAPTEQQKWALYELFYSRFINSQGKLVANHCASCDSYKQSFKDDGCFAADCEFCAKWSIALTNPSKLLLCDECTCLLHHSFPNAAQANRFCIVYAKKLGENK